MSVKKSARGKKQEKVRVAVIGSGNIGVDLMMKIVRTSSVLEVAALVGIDPKSEGLKLARELGVPVTHEGIGGLKKMRQWRDIEIIFDATSAKAHKAHS